VIVAPGPLVVVEAVNVVGVLLLVVVVVVVARVWFALCWRFDAYLGRCHDRLRSRLVQEVAAVEVIDGRDHHLVS
jgi:nitrogen fixation/metabolism regulation signal transduction histidine kinase